MQSEPTVGIMNHAGRSFTGKIGNGTLNSSGDADEDYWPGINGNTSSVTANAVYAGTTGCTGYGGTCLRGGNLAVPSSQLAVSYRSVSPLSNTRNSLYRLR